MAAEGIVHPIYSIMGVISGLLAVGMQVRCTHMIGRGQQKELSRFFSATVYVGTFVSLMTASQMVNSLRLAILISKVEKERIVLMDEKNASEAYKASKAFSICGTARILLRFGSKNIKDRSN